MKLTTFFSLIIGLFIASFSYSQTPVQSVSVSSVPPWFAHCAGENAGCTVTGPTQVIFGSANGNSPKAGGSFVMQTLTGSISCSDAVFGDPDGGHPKACWSGPAPGLGAGKILGVGGSDYAFFVQNYTVWDNNQRTVVGQYHLDPGLVAAQLQQMYQSGQRNVALMIWYLPYGPTNYPVNGVLDGAFLDSSSGQLSAQVQQNLTAVLGLIKQIGFPQVTLRLAPVGTASPETWGNNWNEAVFEQDEAFEFSTRQLAETALAGSSVARTYDLGVEMGGIPHYLNADGVTYTDGQSPAWTSRLWGDYVRRFGKNDSFGFSIAYSFGTLTSAIAEYDAAGTRPNSYAIDSYVVSDIWSSYVELAGAGEQAKPLVLQEVSYNDPTQAQGIQMELQHVPLTVAYIDQWPVSVSVANADASPPTDYSTYGGSAVTTGTLAVAPCALATGQTTCTTQASWSTSNASNVSLYVNGVPAQNAANIASSLTGTTPVTLGLTPSTFQLVSGQSFLSSGVAAQTTYNGLAVLKSQTVAAVDPQSPLITLAGLGGAGNQAIWAMGSNISAGCNVQLYDPNAPSGSPLAVLANPNCQPNSLSFSIPPAVLSNFSAVNLTVSNPGGHVSLPYYVSIH